MALAFNPKDCAHYNVVCFRVVGIDMHMFHIQIYSSDTGKWKILTEPFFAHCPLFINVFVYWNGAIYWHPVYRNHYCFEIEAEQLKSLPLPAEMDPSTQFTTYFGESRGHLHLTVIDYCLDATILLTVYEMLSDHSGWFAKYQVRHDELSGALRNGTSCRYFDVVDIVRGEKEEDSFMVLKIQNSLIKYNLHHKSFEHIFCFRNDLYFAWYEAHRHITTLSYF
ncbi:F-box protein At5g07610-like [Bidens hawaiensis]|uniref:F-box protein At5g07610-like n=1 Tax=Bidens hawaiensis TaxID=980011 RepID=UPI00404B6AA1